MRFATLLALGASLISHVVESKTVVGYLPSWKHQYTKDVNYSKYTHINVAFGIPSEDGSFSFEGDWFLPEVVSDIHSKGPKVLMSVGGWSGSNYLSNILKNSSTRDKFLNSITDYVRQYHLDGIDIDWEYPGREGNAGNAIDPQNDTPNFLKFLQDLRTKFDSSFGGEHKLITLAVRVQPFDGPSGPVADVSEFAKVVDFANLMQYDISGAWLKNTGPNAPFNYDKAKGEPFSFVSAINAWTSAGWPASQLNAGLAFYGRATTALVDMTQDPNNQYQPQSQTLPQGDKEDAPWGGSYSGVWQYKNLRAQSVLGSPESAAKPWVRQWDDITMTPWLFNPSDKMFISYDDTRSIGVKAKYAEERGLGGLMVWTINMDYNDELLDMAISPNGGSSSGSGSGGSTPAPPTSSSAMSSSSSSSLPTSEIPATTLSPTSDATTTSSSPGVWWTPSTTASSPLLSTSATTAPEPASTSSSSAVWWTPSSSAVSSVATSSETAAPSSSSPSTMWWTPSPSSTAPAPQQTSSTVSYPPSTTATAAPSSAAVPETQPSLSAAPPATAQPTTTTAWEQPATTTSAAAPTSSAPVWTQTVESAAPATPTSTTSCPSTDWMVVTSTAAPVTVFQSINQDPVVVTQVVTAAPPAQPTVVVRQTYTLGH